MPIQYLATGHTAGEECSSTYEGRHITLEESYLSHPYHADGFVDGGDPVLIGDNIVGVAFKSAAAATDLIAIDSEGIWFLYVLGCVSDGTSDGIALALHPGDPVFIQRTPGTDIYLLSGESDPYRFAPFGYLLGDVSASTTAPTLVAVKVHNSCLQDLGRMTFGTASTANFLLEGDTTLRRNKMIQGYIAPQTLLTAGEQIYGIQLRMVDDLASTGGECTVAEFKVVHDDNTDVSVSGLRTLKLGVDNQDGGISAFEVAVDITMTGDGAAPAWRSAFQVVGDGTAGTLESWFKTQIAAGLGLKAQVQSLNQNSTHKIPIDIDGVIFGIPVVAWA
jgi:hypothetical protein